MDKNLRHVNSANSISKSEVILSRMIHILLNIELSNQQFDKQVYIELQYVATYVLGTKD